VSVFIRLYVVYVIPLPMLIVACFQSRTPDTITIEVLGSEETYEVLSILDFNNVRKRMSASALSSSADAFNSLRLTVATWVQP